METFHPFFSPGLTTPSGDSRLVGLRYQPAEMPAVPTRKLNLMLTTRFAQYCANGAFFFAVGSKLWAQSKNEATVEPGSAEEANRGRAQFWLHSVDLGTQISKMQASRCGGCCAVTSNGVTSMYGQINGRLVCVFRGERGTPYELDPFVSVLTQRCDGRVLTAMKALLACREKAYRVSWAFQRFRGVSRFVSLETERCSLAGLEKETQNNADAKLQFVAPYVLRRGRETLRISERRDKVGGLQAEVLGSEKNRVTVAKELWEEAGPFRFTERGLILGQVEYVLELRPVKVLLTRLSEAVCDGIKYQFRDAGLSAQVAVRPEKEALKNVWILADDEALYHMVMDLQENIVLQLPRRVQGKTADVFLYKGHVVASQLGGFLIPETIFAELEERLACYSAAAAELARTDGPLLAQPDITSEEETLVPYNEAFVLKTEFRATEISAEERLRNLTFRMKTQSQ